MKTPEEIKKGLEACVAGECRSKRHECPYRKEAECTMALSEDALEHIKQLEAQVPKWISVEERLPEVSDVVLVIANGKPRPNVTLLNAILIASFWEDEGWIADGFEGWDGLRVTHWMELPEPPKEEGV